MRTQRVHIDYDVYVRWHYYWSKTPPAGMFDANNCNNLFLPCRTGLVFAHRKPTPPSPSRARARNSPFLIQPKTHKNFGGPCLYIY